jgi:hypothetical protein
MSDQNLTRREAVKLGGATLAGVGFSTGVAPSGGASQLPGQMDCPDFRGKVVVFYASEKCYTWPLLDPVFEMRCGRLFVAGKSPDRGKWSDGLSVGVAWDAVASYLIYDSVEDYTARCNSHKREEEGDMGATTCAS